MARYTRQFSRYSASREDVKIADLHNTVGREIYTRLADLTLCTLIPWWAVSLYLPHGFSCGSRNSLNCSSEVISTLEGRVVRELVRIW